MTAFIGFVISCTERSLLSMIGMFVLLRLFLDFSVGGLRLENSRMGNYSLRVGRSQTIIWVGQIEHGITGMGILSYMSGNFKD